MRSPILRPLGVLALLLACCVAIDANASGSLSVVVAHHERVTVQARLRDRETLRVVRRPQGFVPGVEARIGRIDAGVAEPDVVEPALVAVAPAYQQAPRFRLVGK